MLRDITCRTHFILTELWHLLDVSAVLGHGAVLAALLFLNKFWYQQDWQRILSFYMNMLFFFFFFFFFKVEGFYTSLHKSGWVIIFPWISFCLFINLS